MGAWGAGPFENDDAADWYGEFLGAPETVSLQAPFADVLAVDAGGWIEAGLGSRAIAAAAVLAVSQAQDSVDEIDDDDVGAILGLEIAPTLASRAVAVRAVRRVLDDPQSELRELWEQAASGAQSADPEEGMPSDYAAWRTAGTGILSALGSLDP